MPGRLFAYPNSETGHKLFSRNPELTAAEIVQGPSAQAGLAQAFLNRSAVNPTARQEDCRKLN